MDETRDTEQVETPAQKRGLASGAVAVGTVAGRGASVRVGHGSAPSDERSTSNAAKVVGEQPEGSGSPGAAADREQATE